MFYRHIVPMYSPLLPFKIPELFPNVFQHEWWYVPSLIYTFNFALRPSITGLLISIPAINKSEANVTIGYRGRQPLFNRGEVIITGNPRVVQGPFGNAMSFTELDSVEYRFSVTQPFPCPFDILQCRNGFTMSFWIQLQNATVSLYREYMKLGNRIIVRKYRSPYDIRFRMYANTYGSMRHVWLKNGSIWQLYGNWRNFCSTWMDRRCPELYLKRLAYLKCWAMSCGWAVIPILENSP